MENFGDDPDFCCFGLVYNGVKFVASITSLFLFKVILTNSPRLFVFPSSLIWSCKYFSNCLMSKTLSAEGKDASMKYWFNCFRNLGAIALEFAKWMWYSKHVNCWQIYVTKHLVG
eukprot:NODE_289_length_11662_cov_0.555133.p7 type:complete len:115 gc:universal NODE_289_length_11662_cov_0.555133:11072-10728(-)